MPLPPAMKQLITAHRLPSDGAPACVASTSVKSDNARRTFSSACTLMPQIITTRSACCGKREPIPLLSYPTCASPFKPALSSL